MKIEKKLTQPILDWCLIEENRNKFFQKPNGHNGIVMGIPHIEKTSLGMMVSNFPFDLMNKIEKKILDFFNFKDFYRDPVYGTMISYSEEGHQVHAHTDPSPREEDTCVRINLFISKPKSGGLAIIDEDGIYVSEGEPWMCLAGEKPHYSQSVVGDKPRVMISFGYQVNKEQLKNRNLL
jgi:hypothetical protein